VPTLAEDVVGQLAVLPQHRETDYGDAATDFDFSDENYELVRSWSASCCI
jgi:hypothetical protein